MATGILDNDCLVEETFSSSPGVENGYELRVLLCPEEEGGYSVIALNLPGVGSQGDTVAEALQNIAEAFQGVMTEYLESGMQIPWKYEDSVEDAPKNSKELWIRVNV